MGLWDFNYLCYPYFIKKLDLISKIGTPYMKLLKAFKSTFSFFSFPSYQNLFSQYKYSQYSRVIFRSSLNCKSTVQVVLVSLFSVPTWGSWYTVGNLRVFSPSVQNLDCIYFSYSSFFFSKINLVWHLIFYLSWLSFVSEYFTSFPVRLTKGSKEHPCILDYLLLQLTEGFYTIPLKKFIIVMVDPFEY